MVKINTPLIKQALLAKQANKRQATSSTKNRGEVRGGGRKPWKQKGTGRARAGSIRSPIWSGGGITFGPDKNRNYKQHLSKKMNRKALSELLNYLLAKKRLVVVKSLALKEAKTKEAIRLLGQHGITGKKVTFITENIEPELVLATRNLSGLTTVVAIDLSILNIANGYVLIEEKAAKRWEVALRSSSVIKKKTLKTVVTTPVKKESK